MFFYFFVVLNVVVSVLSDDHLDPTKLTQDEVRSIVKGQPDPDQDLKIVPVGHIMMENKQRIIRLESFEENITLYLEPSNGHLAGVDTPVYKSWYNPNSLNNVEYEIVPNAIKAGRKLYQDPRNLAALMIEDTPDGASVMRGVVDSYGIQPIPTRLKKHYKREKREVTEKEFLGPNGEPAIEEIHHHVIFKIKPAEIPDDGDIASDPTRSIVYEDPFDDDNRVPVNEVPDNIHPQVLLIVDLDLQKLFKNNMDDLIDYLLAYWNGVDLRYRVFRQPSIRFNIAGIILAQDLESIPYLKDKTLYMKSVKAYKVDVITAIKDMAKFLFKETSYDEDRSIMKFERLGLKYDIAISLTAGDICDFGNMCEENARACGATYKKENVTEKCKVMGYALYPGICAYNLPEGGKDSNKMESIGIVEDHGAFGSIVPAAHEIGHLLGVSHTPTTKGSCADDGYLMGAKLKGEEKSFMWSECSFVSLLKFLRNERRARCLFDEPEPTGGKVTRVLPGKHLSRNEQCQRTTGTSACPWKSNSCTRLYCLSKRYGCVEVKTDDAMVAEGTECGKEHHCINGKCVSLVAETIKLEIGTSTPSSSSSTTSATTTTTTTTTSRPRSTWRPRTTRRPKHNRRPLEEIHP